MTHSLKAETKAAIERLLVQHDVDGKNRGLFPQDVLKDVMDHLDGLADWYQTHGHHQTEKTPSFDEKTVLCISYVDHVTNNTGEKPAVVLKDFFNKHLAALYPQLHILPHFPCPVIHEGVQGPAGRADGGFEALNYKMDPKYGSPEDLKQAKAGLMFDFVLNHLSAKGDLFQKFIDNEPGYENAFLALTDDEVKRLDLTSVFRPREHHPIIPFTNAKGDTKNVWCTFSATQADINIFDPNMFCRIMDALVQDFAAAGATWIRLDAVGYLVKMLGVKDREALTDCFGIPETHNILKAMRCFLTDIAPHVALVPEVNATEEVIASYYGQNDEGHIVYDFPSAPVSLFSIYREDASAVLAWAKNRAAHPDRIGLAFTSTHDGVGVLPLSDVAEVQPGVTALDFFVKHVEARNGGINFKAKKVNGQNVRVPYEACITWLQAILTPEELADVQQNRLSHEQAEVIVNRFMASQSFIYAGPHCVPADYMGVVTALLNDEKLFAIDGHNRNKNRGLVEVAAFEKAMQKPETSHEVLRNMIFARKSALIKARGSSSAFSPSATCIVDVLVSADAARPVYSVLRISAQGNEKVLALTNATPKTQTIALSESARQKIGAEKGVDILAVGDAAQVNVANTITLTPHQVMWVRL